MTDLDLRLVRYFTVVARHGNVGRAAAELHVAQPSLSRQLTELERRVGITLLARTPQGTRLTPAGNAFLPHAIALLDRARDGIADAVAVQLPARLTIGYTTGLIVNPLLDRLRTDRPDIEVSARHLDWAEARPALVEHRVDAALTRLPLRGDGLRVTALYDEPRVLLVADTHRLAEYDEISLADIADEPVPRLGDTDFDAFWTVDPRPDGRPAPPGPLVHTIQDKIELVAAGSAVAVIPRASGAIGLRPGLTTVVIRDIEPARVVVATRSGDERPGISSLMATARTMTAPDG